MATRSARSRSFAPRAREVRALMPFWGAEEWQPLPVNSAMTPVEALAPRPTRLPGTPPEDGCIIRAKSTSSKAPRSSRWTLPAPPSSAGVPMMETVPSNWSARAVRPRNAATEQVEIRLWPQPWPTPLPSGLQPGSASYSARNATRGPGPLPCLSARKEVAISQ